MLKDLLEPLLPAELLAGTRVADIGSGTGRIVNMLCDAGVREVLAVEPSDAFLVLKENTKQRGLQVQYLRAPGDQIPPNIDLDFIVSFGVLHHIPNPDPVVKAAREALHPGGKLIVWLYGYEGNELYLNAVRFLRAVTIILPDRLLGVVSWLLTVALLPYAFACKFLKLPMQDYFLNHFMKLSWTKRQLTIFDQLNPRYAKYYRKEEAIDLLERGGFQNVLVYHRHGYSWTVIGQRPA